MEGFYRTRTLPAFVVGLQSLSIVEPSAISWASYEEITYKYENQRHSGWFVLKKSLLQEKIFFVNVINEMRFRNGVGF